MALRTTNFVRSMYETPMERRQIASQLKRTDMQCIVHVTCVGQKVIVHIALHYKLM
jgi:hypothetical protein